MDSGTGEGSQTDQSSLSNSTAFRQLQRQIQKLRRYYLSEGYSQKEITDMLHEILLQKKNQNIDWKRVGNTSDFYKLQEHSNNTTSIAESALKFKKEINQIKSLCLNIHTHSSSLPSSQKKHHLPTEEMYVQNINDTTATVQKKNTLIQEKKTHFKGSSFHIDEISDRFLYRLDKNCTHDKSSSSSENSESEQYQYRINTNLIQTESTLHKSLQSLSTTTQPSNLLSTKNNTPHSPSHNHPHIPTLPVNAKQKFSEVVLNNLPETRNISSIVSTQHQSTKKKSTTISSNPNTKTGHTTKQTKEENTEITFANNYFQEDTSSDSTNPHHDRLNQKKKKRRKQQQLNYTNSSEIHQSPHSIDRQEKEEEEEFEEMRGEKRTKRVCREAVLLREDKKQHHFSGKKRSHMFHPFSKSDICDFQEFPDLDDLHLFEKKLRYYTDNDDNRCSQLPSKQ